MTKPLLLVEDDDNDVFLLTRALKKLEIKNPLHVACDGQQAVDYVEGRDKFSNRAEFPFPYLMLLDLKLPQIKGLDVLKRVRQLSDRGPIIIILSSSKCEMDISEAYRLGANAYLNKARDLDGLIELVRAIDGFWLKHNLVATMTDGMDEFGSGEEGRLTA